MKIYKTSKFDKLVKEAMSKEDKYYGSGSFSVIDNFGLTELEREALDGQLCMISTRMDDAGLGQFASGMIELGSFDSAFTGKWTRSDNKIILNVPKMLVRGRHPRFVGLEVLYHEIGHRIFDSLSLQWKSWYYFEFKSSATFVSSHARTSPEEDFAEIFRAVGAGRIIDTASEYRFYSTLGEILKQEHENYEYLGTCISTVDDSCMWDATEMAQLIENSDKFDIYGVYPFLSNELKQKVENNPSTIECGVNNDIVWVYDTIEDIHYFYKKS